MAADTYYYCPCQSRDTKSNEAFQHYFRLYKKVEGGKDILVEQGNHMGITDGWEKKYRATFTATNPYPLLD